MPMIDSDELKPALKAVSDAQKAWESALINANDTSQTLRSEEYHLRMDAVGDAEQKFYRSACYLAFRVQALVDTANANLPPRYE